MPSLIDETKPVYGVPTTASVRNNFSIAKSEITALQVDKADTTYVNSLVVGLLDDRGSYNASVNTFPASGGSGTAGAILKGDLWFISVAGTLGGVAVTAGDSVRALVDAPGQIAANWSALETNIGYVPENITNKVTSISGASTDTQYPSAKLTFDQLAQKANLTSNTFTGVQTLSAGAIITSRIVTAATTATLTINADITDGYILTAQAVALTLANPTGTFSPHQELFVEVLDNGTSSAFAYGNQWIPFAAALPTASTISKRTLFALKRNAANTNWMVLSNKEV